mgnify:CR=1 FL=1
MISIPFERADHAQSCLLQAHGIVTAVFEGVDVQDHHRDALQAAADLLEQLGAELGIHRFQAQT